MTMTLTQALNATRGSTKRPEDYDATLFLHHQILVRAKEEKAQHRRIAFYIGLFSFMFVGVLLLGWYEQAHMTDEQRATIEHIIN